MEQRKDNIYILVQKGRSKKLDQLQAIFLQLYKIFTRVITTRLTNKSVYRASRLQKMRSQKQKQKKTNEYNLPLFVAFVDYEKPFDNIELWFVEQALNISRVDSRYRSLIHNIYQGATIKIYLEDDLQTRQMAFKRGDTISPKLFTFAMEHIFKKVKQKN